MSYNLLLNSDFKNNLNKWELVNCTYKDGYLESSDKVFGIYQELVLADISKLYLRFIYQIENISIKNVKVGIESNGVLEVNMRVPKLRKSELISVINKPKTEKIKLHLIFESDTKINKVYINEPLLVDLITIGKGTWLKWILDRTLKYRPGYCYSNEYIESEIKPNNIDFKDLQIEEAKIGSIIKVDKKDRVELTAKFIKDNYYLIKLDYEDINKFGQVRFTYKESCSQKFGEEQIYLLFKYIDGKVYLELEGNDELPYQINIKHLLIVNITNLHLLKVDVPYLPFI